MHILFQRKHANLDRETDHNKDLPPPLFFFPPLPTGIMLEVTQLLNGEISTVFPDSDSPVLTSSLLTLVIRQRSESSIQVSFISIWNLRMSQILTLH